jgi:hypothetical protein
VRLDSDDRAYSTDFGGSARADVVAEPTPRDGLPCLGRCVLGRYSVVVLSR